MPVILSLHCLYFLSGGTPRPWFPWIYYALVNQVHGIFPSQMNAVEKCILELCVTAKEREHIFNEKDASHTMKYPFASQVFTECFL
jgi:hypothetical protein